MTGPLYLAWRYLLQNKGKTSILVASIALIAFLPAGLNVLVGQSAADLAARAVATPLLVGARGSPVDLALSSLYFGGDAPAPIPWEQVERIADTGLAAPIPLHIRFRAQGAPIVGTTLDYLEFRRLRFTSGRAMAVLGECVVGSRVAERLGIGPGDELISSPETVFDLAGVYPLKMRVTGVLAPSHTPDDEAVFVDIKTAWVIEGLGHGHDDLASPEAEAAVLSRDDSGITANASVVEYNTIDSANLAAFHFHGDTSGYPVTAVIAVPPDDKARVLLMGRYQRAADAAQIIQPSRVIDELLGTVFTIRGYVVAAVGLVGAATLATAALVFLLSLRLRRREIETLFKIGASRGSVAAVWCSEVLTVLLLSAALAAGLTVATSRFGSALIQELLL